mmetsp:Transcript_5327/g.8588  ORF Transcript_5327/g.8588 Transcript_5327/m.8588 type:complete len:142 (+) Transcript_5327:380-805(+)
MSKKKKPQKKKAERAEVDAVCAACQARCGTSRIACVCTRVVFCARACSTQALRDGSHACQGAPSPIVDLAQQARDVLGADTSHGHFNNREGIEEMQRTVTSQLRMGLPGGPQRPELPEFVRCTDTGNLDCTYQAGIGTSAG